MFNPSKGYVDRPLMIPCGQCIGCRLERSRQWAIRCTHEASLHEHNSFVTLTYNQASLPENGSLSKRHFQLFMKRLRKQYGPGIRFYGCGEYGEKLGRPHYHVCLFNFDPPDKVAFKKTRDGQILYTSLSLDEIWGLGFTLTGSVTFQSAAYVARYIIKKINGAESSQHYDTVDPDTGEVTQELLPEFTTMSRRPGIGNYWLKKFQSDIYDHDFVVINSKKMRPPRYYDKQFELTNSEEFDTLKRNRKRGALKHADNNTRARLEVREKVQQAKLGQLNRKLEGEDDD